MKNKNIFIGIILLAFIIAAVIVYSQLNNSYLISGEIYNNRVELDNLIKADYILIESGEDGSVYRAEFLDSNNNLLRTFRFGVSEQADYETQELYKEFYFILNLPAETSKIIIKENGNVIHEFIITQNSPVVENVEINDLGNGEFQINWQASDVDGEALKYNLYYGGNNIWDIINLEITETNYLLETSSEYFPGGNYKIKVVASDGFNTGEAISLESFSVAKKQPSVLILNIDENTKFYESVSVVLEGFVYDTEDGELNGLWKLDGLVIGGEEIIVLENPEYGIHLIELSALDSDNNEVIDSIEIFVDYNPDITEDRFVGGADLTRILSNWGVIGATINEGDISKDGFVGGDDLNVILGYWGGEI